MKDESLCLSPSSLGDVLLALLLQSPLGQSGLCMGYPCVFVYRLLGFLAYVYRLPVCICLQAANVLSTGYLFALIYRLLVCFLPCIYRLLVCIYLQATRLYICIGYSCLFIYRLLVCVYI